MGVWQPRVLTIACLLMSKMDKVTGLLIKSESPLGFIFGVRAQTDLRYGVLQACVS